jgi:TATA-box binding protein (TBP) (component of TFIID and TFIIIB)
LGIWRAQRREPQLDLSEQQEEQKMNARIQNAIAAAILGYAAAYAAIVMGFEISKKVATTPQFFGLTLIPAAPVMLVFISIARAISKPEHHE